MQQLEQQQPQQDVPQICDPRYKSLQDRVLKERLKVVALYSGSVAIVSASTALVGFQLPIEKFVRLVSTGLAGVMTTAGIIKSHKLTYSEEFWSISREASLQWWAELEASRLFQPGGQPIIEDPEVLAQLAEGLEFFDWQLFNADPNKWPHLGIIGGTGDGKSHTTEWAMNWLDGAAIVCHPHKKPSDYPNLRAVYCAARNYGNWKQDQPVTFQQLLDGTADEIPGRPKVSFASFIKTLEVEMDRRYQLYAQGIEDYPMVNIVLDEYNTAVSKVPQAVEVVKNLWREARKVKIRLICLLQNDSVKSLKIDGDGELRKCLKFIRLGGFASTHAKRLKDEALLAWVKAQKYPILVEDLPALLTPIQPRQTPVTQPQLQPRTQTQTQLQTYSLDLSRLVRVPIADARLLPARPGVYFVIDSSFKPHYIGSSSNIMLRWNSQFGEHDRLSYFEDLEALGMSVSIAAYPCQNYQDEEDRLIAEFRPYLNGRPINIRPEEMRQFWDNSFCNATDNSVNSSCGVSTTLHQSPSYSGESLHHTPPLLHQHSTTPQLHSPVPPNWQFPDPMQPPPVEVETVVIACKCSGYSQSRTIREVWGIERSGTDPRYRAARSHYQRIIEEAGLS